MLTALRQLRLPNRPWHTSVSEDGRRFCTCSPSGQFSWFDSDLNQLGEFQFEQEVAWMQFDADGSRLVVGFGHHIEGYAVRDTLSKLFRLAVVDTSVACCAFVEQGEVLCVASNTVLQAWNLEASTLISQVTLPNSGGGYMLVPHPEGEIMGAINYSGQSEELSLWARCTHGELRLHTHPVIEDVVFPCFHPTGREFISAHERLGLYRMRFPSGELLASINSAEAFPDDPEDGFGYDIHYASENRVIGLAGMPWTLRTRSRDAQADPSAAEGD